MNVPEIPLKRPPPPPKHKTMDFQTESTKDRLYPKPPPFSAREYYKQWEEDKRKPYESVKRAPRLHGKYTMYGIERESRKPKPPPPERVEAYIDLLRKSRPKYQKPFTPRPLLKAQIPIKLVNQFGADIVRLWATSVAYQQDVRISNDIMKQISENYRKIRNTMRFVLGNLNDFKENDLVAIKDLAPVDRYMLAELNDLIDGYNNAYENFDFAEANQLILNYFTNLLSSFYMDFTKDILYIEKADSLRRRQVQTVLYYHAKIMMKLISPVLVFTAEELHDHFHCDENKAESVFLEPAYQKIELEDSESLKEYFKRFLDLRKDVLKALEQLRNDKVIKSNMEAKVTISLKDDYKDMEKLADDLKQLFIVAKVNLVEDTTLEEFDSAYIKAEKFNGHQCPRCWNYFDEDEMEGELCHRCHDVING